MLTASVVINTFNRADSLGVTLDALTLLDYPQFEVIVVNGPSTDRTSEVLASWGTRIKTVQTDQRNLSISRNLGIAAASGEIVAFIDDDAYPDPAWLDCIAAAYDRDEIAGAGGPVYDHTGVTFQTFYTVSDRSGTSWNEWPPMVNPTDVLNHPYSLIYPSLLGTNSSFRRRHLIEIGGFDEEFDYYLDETDVCIRLIDRGYVIRALDQGFVYHKFLASHLRTETRVLRNRYSVIKNRLYFALRHGNGNKSLDDIRQDALTFVESHRREYRSNVNQGVLTEADLVTFERDVHRAFDTAFAHARDNVSTGHLPPWFDERQSPFLPFKTRRQRSDKLHLCFFSQDYPPGPVGGIGHFARELAVGLAELGHHVHVLTRGRGHSTVDLEDGVWVHRVLPRSRPAPRDVNVPPAIWDYSASLYEEALRINAHRSLDLIQVPLWDAEGIAAILGAAVPTVLSLHTSLPMEMEFNPHWLDDSAHRGAGLESLNALERLCLERCSFVLANSNAGATQIAACHDIAVDHSRLVTVPHGLIEPPTTEIPHTQSFEAYKEHFTRSVMAKAAEDLYRRLARGQRRQDKSMHQGLQSPPPPTALDGW
jgi:glycogen(starch) synthase